ncbi:MAG TPA: PilZ domain-containing protein [Bacillota bacterium]|nr:PilZ domain-containing protein [Bacillota bacterium]
MKELKKYFNIADKVQIEYYDKVGELRQYVSQVVDIHDGQQEEFIDVLIPMYKSMDVNIMQGSVLKLIVFKGDAIYEIRTIVYKKIFGSIPLLRLKAISEIIKKQRRDYYRLKIFREIEARLVIDPDEEKYSETFICNLQDISAGGLMFSSREYFNENDTLEFALDLNGPIMVVQGVIVRRILNESYRLLYTYGVQYINLNMADRNAITKFIFEEQRRLIKKGLI